MKHLRNFIYGIILGITNVIPGVSGGTMAVILNVYDDILYAISWKNFKKYIPFLGVLGAGVLMGILLFSRAITYLLQHFELPVYYSFIGLIIGSIPMIYRKARNEKVKSRNLVIFFLSFGFMVVVALLNRDTISGNTLEDVGGPSLFLYLWLFATSLISTIAMILPGISGSLVMLLLGAYTISMEAIAKMDLMTLTPIGLGVTLGGFLGIKFVKTLLRFHPQALYFGILGLITGSLFTIYPGPPVGSQGVICIMLMVLAMILAYIFSKK